MSKTYLAEDLTTEDAGARKFIIKSLNLKDLSDWKILQLFEREAETLRNLDHSRVPKYVDYFSESLDGDIAFYLVYEHIRGRSLDDHVTTRGPMDTREVERIMRELLEILRYLHGLEPKVIHRDINPKNIIMKEDGTVYLVDFGACRNLMKDFEGSGGTTFVGTSGYVPMEQMIGDAEARSDLYALGMTAVHLLTGKNPTRLPMRALKPVYRSADTYSRLDRVIDRLIEPDIENRSSSAEDALAMLAGKMPTSGRLKNEKFRVELTDTSGKHIVIRERGGARGLIFSNEKSKRTESMLLKMLLNLWLTKPWIVILIVAAVTGGPAFIPLFFLYRSNRVYRWLQREYSKVSEVEIMMDRDSIKVPGQMRTIPFDSILDMTVNKTKGTRGYQLEVLIYLRNGKTRSFYLSELSEEEADTISCFLMEA